MLEESKITTQNINIILNFLNNLHNLASWSLLQMILARWINSFLQFWNL